MSSCQRRRTSPESLVQKALAEALTLLDPSGELIEGPFQVIEFDTPPGLACPMNRDNPGFEQGGMTAGGVREYVIDNYKITELVNVTTRIVP